MIRKMLLLTILINLLGTNVYSQDAVHLEKEAKAPFSGFLINDARTIELRNAEIDAKQYKAINESYQKSLDLSQSITDSKNKEIDALLVQNDKLATSAAKVENINFWEKIAYFAAGVIITGFAVKEAHEIYK